MTILLIGKDGQVGHELHRALSELGDVVAVGRDRVDLTRPATIDDTVDAVGPDLIVNAAAYTAVDRAEEETDLARQINATAPGKMAEAAEQVGAWLVHYSTDYVFDGTARRPYTEDDRAVPLNAYGRTKREGEQAIQAVGPKHLILRTSWVYSDRRSNFLKTMLRLGRECQRGERERLTVVDDQIGVPTSAVWLADTTASIVKTLWERDDREAHGGLYHVTGTGQTSWYGFARAIFARFGLEDVEVVPVSTDEYPTPATRPAYTVLDSTRVQSVFDVDVPTWTQQLADLNREERPAGSGAPDEP